MTICSFLSGIGTNLTGQNNLLELKSISTHTSTLATSSFPKTISGTAAIIHANESFSSCATSIGSRIISLKPGGLIFLNLELRDEILAELRLQMEGVYVASDGGDRAFPLLSDYFFYIRANGDTLAVQLVDARTGEILWSFSKSASKCDEVLTAISSQL